jgi:Ca2+/H+ antiporter, TMEM165/GDT1 family
MLKVLFFTNDIQGGQTMMTPLAAFLITLGTVTLAEMGDKTQMLTMTFAVRYKPYKVVIGIFIAIVLLNALAVAAGTLLAQYSALTTWIQLAASLSFIVFALWSLREGKPEEEKPGKARLGPVATVAAAFFVAELGDKTQLAAVALAAKFPEAPFPVFLGATLGLLAADGLGIFIGAVFCRKLPEKVFRLISAVVFFLFGFYGVWEIMEGRLGVGSSAAILAALAAITGLLAWSILRKKGRTRGGEDS